MFTSFAACLCCMYACAWQAWQSHGHELQRCLHCYFIAQVQRMEQRVEHGTMGTKQPGTVGMGGHRVVAEE